MPFPGSGPSDSDAATRGTGQKEMTAWFIVASETLRRAVADAGTDPLAVLPTRQAVDAAVRSGSFDTPEARAAVDALRAGSEQYGVRFVEPPEGAPL